jgi:hypothetical protein
MTSGIPFTTTDVLPPEVCDRSAWYGAEIAEHHDWIERLSAGEIREVEDAVHDLASAHTQRVRSRIRRTSNVDHASRRSTPSLAPRLKQLLDEVLNGRGFVLIKGTAH